MGDMLLYVIEYESVADNSVRHFEIIESENDVQALWDWADKMEYEGFDYDDWVVVSVELYGIDGMGW